MRLVYFFACLIVAWGLVEKAVGVRPDQIFGTGYEWLNFVGAGMWLLYGIGAFFWEPR